MKQGLLFFLMIGMGLSGCARDKNTVTYGFSPNLTHAQALVGEAKQKFQETFGSTIKVKSQVFHAGPSIVEALFAGALDFAYLGPSPAINCFTRSKGEFVVIAGAAQGGAALVKSKGAEITSAKDLDGKRVLTPQLANTQDITARAYFLENNLEPEIYPVSNPDQINIFKKNQAEAAWTVEPWVSRLIHETGASVVFNESEVWGQRIGNHYATTLLVVRRSLIKEKPHWVQWFLETHIDITNWINAHPREAKDVINTALAHHVGKPLEEKTLSRAFDQVTFTWQPGLVSLSHYLDKAKKIGFLKDSTLDIKGLFYSDILQNAIEPVSEFAVARR